MKFVGQIHLNSLGQIWLDIFYCGTLDKFKLCVVLELLVPYPYSKCTPQSKNRCMELDITNYLAAQIVRISKNINNLHANNFHYNFVCQICIGNHLSYECQLENPFYPPSLEQDHYMSNYQLNNPYSNIYNPG